MVRGPDALVADWLAAHGLASVPSEPVTVVADESRRGSGLASAYVIDEAMVIPTDPELVDRVAGFDRVAGPIPEAFVDAAEAMPAAVAQRLGTWVAWSTANGGRVLGTGVQRAQSNRSLKPAERSTSDGANLIAIDRANPEHVLRVGALLEQCSDDEVDDADIDLDELDDVIWCAGAGDELVAYASARPFETTPRWWDIGVLTHPDHRRRGLAGVCTAAVVESVRARGDEALYRHSVLNLGSAAVASALGFEPAMTLVAISFSEANN